MPKLKKEPFINENKKNLFFYEILGVILLMLSFFALAKLGIFGFYLNLTVKLIFGDWSFLFIILGLILGGYFLFMHQNIPLTSLRLIGIILIFISLSVLSHFSMHDYVEQYTNEYFKTTINLYFDYYKTANSAAIVGGGLFGMLFFYLFYHLISTPGVIIISICLLFLGISFISKKTLIDFSLLFVNIFKKILKFIKTRGSKFKSFIDKINSEFSIYTRKKLPKNFITKNPINKKTPTEELNTITNDIKVILNKINLFHYEVSSYDTPHLMVFEIKSLLSIDLLILEQNLVNYLNIPFLLKYNEDDNIIMIEVLNPHLRKISLYESLNYIDDQELFISIDDHNNIISLDKDHKNILLFCQNLDTFTFYILLKLIKIQNHVILIDLKKELFNFKEYVNVYQTSFDYFDQLIVDIEKSIETAEFIYCYINLDIKDNDIDKIINKLRYILQLSKTSNFYFIIRIDQYLKQNQYFYDLFNYLYTIDNSDIEVLKLFGFNNANGLKVGSEGLLKDQDLVMRVANVNLSEKEKNAL